jgi:DNA-binding GntR family transcriptional regulator
MSKEILAQQIADRMRRDILRGVLVPGASIKERDIAVEMGVSRTPIRESIRILAQEGLVALRPSRSPIVTISDHIEFEELTVVLIALEKLSASLACEHATEADFEKMRRLVEEIADHYDDGDPLDIFELDMAFHTAIAQSSGNKTLAETHGTLVRRVWRARYLAAIERRNGNRIVDQHRQIYDALVTRDADAAEAAVNNHLRGLAQDIRAIIERDSASGIPA